MPRSYRSIKQTPFTLLSFSFMMKLLLILIVGAFSLVWCTTKQVDQPTVGGDNPQFTGDLWSTKTETMIDSQIPLIILEGTNESYTGMSETIWCNDKLISKTTKVSINEASKFTDTFRLLTKYNPESDGMINPWLGQDKAVFDSYEVADGNVLIIKITWWLKINGVCDTPRLTETLKKAYKGFGFSDVKLRVDGQPISYQ